MTQATHSREFFQRGGRRAISFSHWPAARAKTNVWWCGAGEAHTTTPPHPKSGGAGGAAPLLAKPFGVAGENEIALRWASRGLTVPVPI